MSAVDQAPETPPNRTWIWVLIGMGIFSVAISVYLMRDFIVTKDHLKVSLKQLHKKGKALDVEQCVDEVIRWRRTCKAASKLCDSFAPRAMSACLIARDRSAYCASLKKRKIRTDTVRFGVKDCRRRGLKRWTKKACAGAYQAIHVYCTEKVKPRA